LIAVQYVLLIQQFTAGAHDECIGCCDGDPVVAEFQRELAASDELLVLPARVIGVGAHPWKPLRDLVDGVARLLEPLVTATCSKKIGIYDEILPLHFVFDDIPGFQWIGKINSHHCVDDDVVKAGTVCIPYSQDVVTTVKLFFEGKPAQPTDALFFFETICIRQISN